jgi:hypothetical protein
MSLAGLLRALAGFALCMLGGVLMAAVLALVWPMPVRVFVILAVFLGAVPWLTLVTPTRRTLDKRSRT